RDSLGKPRLCPEVAVADIGLEQGRFELVLVPLAPPIRIDEDLVEPTGQGVANAVKARAIRRLMSVDPGPPRRRLIRTAEHSFESGLFRREMRPLAPVEALLELDPVQQHGVNEPGEFIAHDRSSYCQSLTSGISFGPAPTLAWVTFP